MVASIPSFRALYDLVFDRGGTDAYHDVLLPWHSQALEAMSILAAYGRIEARTWRPDEPDPCSGGDRHYYTCLEHLYALSRVSDILLLPFQPVREPMADYVWTELPSIRLEERNEWLHSLGMHEVSEAPFHPFFHEIVEVEQAPDPDEPITRIATLWPAFLLGQLLFSRAGVRVRGGAQHIRKDIAEQSRLYWAFARNNRAPVDLSHGWGHNSQWSTDFRRDYLDMDAYYYNVDGHFEVHEEWGPDLAVPARIELLRHRCFILTPEQFYNEDLWDATYRELR